MNDHTDKGVISQIRALYVHLTAGAGPLARRDQQTWRGSGPVTKALIVACSVMGLIAAGILVYGIIAFPDAPVRQTASGYIGKHGAPYTQNGYDRFRLWEKLMMTTFGFALLTGFGAVVSRGISRWAHKNKL
jgi:hypothetical protein